MNAKPKFFIDGSNVARNGPKGQGRLFRVISLCVYLAESGYKFYCIFDASLLGKINDNYLGSYLPKEEIPIAVKLIGIYPSYFEMVKGGIPADRPLVLKTHEDQNSILISSDLFNKPDDEFALDKDWLKKSYNGAARLVNFYINNDENILLINKKWQPFTRFDLIPLDRDLEKLMNRLDAALNPKKNANDNYKRTEVTVIPNEVTILPNVTPKTNIAKNETISPPTTKVKTNIEPKADPEPNINKYILLFLLLIATAIVGYFLLKPTTNEIASLPVAISDKSSLPPHKDTVDIQEPDINRIRGDLKEKNVGLIDTGNLKYFFISDTMHYNNLIRYELTERLNYDMLFEVDYAQNSVQWFYNGIREISQPIRLMLDTSKIKTDTLFRTDVIDSPAGKNFLADSNNAGSPQTFLSSNIPVYEHPFTDPNFVTLTSIIIENNNWTPAQMKDIQFYLSQDLILTKEVPQENSEIVHGKIKIIAGNKKDKIIIKAGTKGVLIDMPKPTKMLVSFEGGDENYLSFGVNPNLKNKYMLLASEWSNGIGKIHYAGKEYFTDENGRKAFLVINIEKINETNIKSHKAGGRKLK